MLIELDEQQIQLILQSINYKLDRHMPMSEEDIEALNRAQVSLYNAVQRYKSR
jgi:hypothetical protein